MARYAIIAAAEELTQAVPGDDKPTTTLKTWYFERQKEPFSGIYTLPSLGFEDPDTTLPDPHDPISMQALLDRLSEERLNGQPVHFTGELIAAGERHLREPAIHPVLYVVGVRFPEGVDVGQLNPAYYTDAKPMTQNEFEDLGVDCGLCNGLYWDARAMDPNYREFVHFYAPQQSEPDDV